jgi:sugar phosphate isomerase/epimerase
MTWPLLCSTGAFTRYPDYTDYRRIVEIGPRLAAGGLELMVFPNWLDQLDQIAADLSASGLSFPAMHAEKSVGGGLGSAEPAEVDAALTCLEANCRLGQALGARLLILHLWDLPGSDHHFERNLAALERCLPLVDEYGIGLAVETIPCSKGDPLSNLARALAHDDRCLAALDTEFLCFHNQLEESLAADWLWSGGRVRHLHLKDYDGRPSDDDGWRRYLHPGEGRLDFAAIFAGLARQGFAGNVCLEASAVGRDGGVDVKRLNESLARVRQWMEQP